MSQSAILSERDVHRSVESRGGSSFEKLQELTRHGYVPDPQPLANGDGILLRHRSAPDLILWADGTVDVPLGQPAKAVTNRTPAPVRKQRRWGRALLIFGALAIYTFISFLFLIALTE